MIQKSTRGARALWLVLSLLPATVAYAVWPPKEGAVPIDYSVMSNWPTDPGYTTEFGYWSFVPNTDALPLLAQVDMRTKTLGTGSNFDRAWSQTVGDPRIIIAVTDSGANWSNADLVNRWYLNAGELPPPACGNNNTLHDRNNDGRFNVQDYTSATGVMQPLFTLLCDKRIKDVNSNGIVDPQDLIAAFSDNVDTDNNGYVDDIAGWDFFHNDNNAIDDTNFAHGDVAAAQAAAQANNALASLGTCPSCSVMMLRTGDSLYGDASLFGVATAYAVDSGAAVVAATLGTYNNTPLGQAAIDYAYAHNVTLIASSNDGDSFRHTFPGTNNHTIVVNALTHDTPDLASATTFFDFNNCTNYGAQVDFSLPTADCSSPATGRAAGLAGLKYSAALTANINAPTGVATDLRRLTANEVKQLLTTTVDNFYAATDTGDVDRYPTVMGFARRFGYGRPNARTAIDAINAQKWPPAVDITSPAWFDGYNQAHGTSVVITGRVGVRAAPANPAADTFDYTVEWAPGVDPVDSAFTTIGGMQALTAEVNGTLATWGHLESHSEQQRAGDHVGNVSTG